MPGSHLFAGVNSKNLEQLVQLAADYDGPSEVFNSGDSQIPIHFCQDSILWAKLRYPDVERRLKSKFDPLISIQKAIDKLGFKPNDVYTVIRRKDKNP